MLFYRELLDRAGISHMGREISISLIGLAVLVFSLLSVMTEVAGLGICLGLLSIAASLEGLRLRGESRSKSFESGWPQIFDSFHSAALSGIALPEQLEYLANKGPSSHRSEFSLVSQVMDQGKPLGSVLSLLQSRFSSRHADLLVLLLELESEMGGVGIADSFAQAASSTRREQAELGHLLAKQGWVALSAKIALLAPWLIALVLVQLPQNRQAFATEIGSLVLVLGLTLSVFAYFLVNRLGHLPLPKRVLNGNA